MRGGPDAQIGFTADSPLWLDMLDAMMTQGTSGPFYELGDLIEDGIWKSGRRPAGWGRLP